MNQNFLRVLAAAAVLIAQTAAASIPGLSSVAKELASEGYSEFSCNGNDIVTVGVLPLSRSRLPIEINTASALYEQFIVELERYLPGCVRMMDNRGADVTLSYLSQTGVDRDQLHSKNQVLRSEMSDAQIILDARFLEQGSRLVGVFRLTDRSNGSLMSQVSVLIPSAITDQYCGDQSKPFDQALEETAERLLNRSTAIELLTVLGGYYKDTDASTALARFIEDQLVANLSLLAENALTGNRLRVQRLREAKETQLAGLRGVDISSNEFSRSAVTLTENLSEEQPHRLIFRYWPCEDGNAARIIIRLIAADGVEITEVADVALLGLPGGLEVHPIVIPNDASALNFSDFEFQLASEKGPNPTYHAGDNFRFAFRLAQSSWVYCFYTDSEQHTMRILPYEQEAHGGGSNFFKAQKLYFFPDPHRKVKPDLVRLEIDDSTTGVETLFCAATTRDIRKQLPEIFSYNAFQRMSQSPEEILQSIQSLSDIHVSKAELTVTVMDKTDS